MNILTSIENILPIILIIALGFYLNEKGWFGTEFGGNISRLIMNVALPSSIFISVLKYLTLTKLVAVAHLYVWFSHHSLYCSICYR